MKKVIAILMLHVFLFNLIGYKLVFSFLEHQSDLRMEAKLADVEDKDLITVKIPIRLPYHTDWKDFERVDGEATYKGIIYKYVKQKVYQDTLILLCLNYKEKAKLQKGSTEYFKKTNGLSGENNKKPVAKTFKCDYYESIKSPVNALYAFEFVNKHHIAAMPCMPGFLNLEESPPEQASC